MWIIIKKAVDKITNALGAANDTGGSVTGGSLFAKLNAIITNTATIITNTTTAITNTATTITNTATNNTANKSGLLSQKASYTHSLLENGTYGLSALRSAITNIGGGGSSGAVKSVQRGYRQGVSSGNVTISISSVNINKTIVLLDSAVLHSKADASQIGMPALVSLTSTTLTVTNPHYYYNGTTPTYFSWQVIEFY